MPHPHFFLLTNLRLAATPVPGLLSLLAPRVKPGMLPAGGKAGGWAAPAG